MAKRLLSLILCMLFLAPLVSCASSSPQDIIGDGMDEFSSGKSEEEYYFPGSGALLDDLIDKFSGSYFKPSGTPMTDDEHDKDKHSHSGSKATADPNVTADPNFTQDPNVTYDPNVTADPTVTEPPEEKIPEVSNMTELLRVLHKAYDDTAEYVEFKTKGGFTFDPSMDLQATYTRLQREDPIDASGVQYWSYWNSGSEYYIKICYSFEIDEFKRMKAETITLVEDAVNRIGAQGKSDYEIVDAVNEYLCDNVYYPISAPYEPITHTAYGALKNGCAVCEGYACAVKLILSAYGIESDIEVGTCPGGGGHAWNLVKLDGQWYQLDVTWNDQSHSRHDFFLVTDDFMKKSRTWDENLYPVTSKTPYTAP